MTTPATIESKWPMYFPADPTKTPPWSRGFADIALRGLLKLHLDYLLWSTPQDFQSTTYHSQLLDGPGVAHADDVTACAAITQEFLSSRSAFGAWVPETPEINAKSGVRYYLIRREVPYPTADSSRAHEESAATAQLAGDGGAAPEPEVDEGKSENEESDEEARKRADIVVERVEPQVIGGAAAPTDSPTNAKGGQNAWKPVFIEAKRAYIWSTTLDSFDAKAQQKPRSNKGGIAADIKKLRKNCPANSMGFILVWNIVDKSKGTDVWPGEFFSSLKYDNSIVLWQVRAAPLVSQTNSSAILNGTATAERWLWVALAEVTEIPAAEVTKPSDYQYIKIPESKAPDATGGGV